MKKKLSLKIFDYLSFGIVVLVFVISLLIYFMPKGKNLILSVKTKQSEFLYNLDEDIEMSFSGPLGETLIEIKDQKVKVLASPCSEQICVNSGWILHQGQWIGCLPNQVFLYIEGREDNGIDAYSF